MKEVIYTTKKNGILALLLTTLFLIASFGLFIGGIAAYEAGKVNSVPAIIGFICLVVGWIPYCGLKVLKPQEALVLTLFGSYRGTIREPGFYFVNPFCSAVNPAATTKLAQSGDSRNHSHAHAYKNSETGIDLCAGLGKKVSLKAMTLNNGIQKINDCLGNPIEIGIAVIWRVTDTAKAVFDVDNYKEYLSLQCDSALRNIVRIYPYDVSPDVDTTGDGVADEGSLRGSAE